MTKGKSGTFTGDGRSTVSLNIGFAPDIVFVTCHPAYGTSGWAGIGQAVICRRDVTIACRHNNTSATSVTANVLNFDYETGGEYGASHPTSYCVYGEYSDGTFTINNHNPGTGTVFRNGIEYEWQAFAE